MLVLILLSIVHLFDAFYNLQMMHRGGAFFQPAEEQQYIDSRVLSASTSFTKSLNDIANHTKQVFLITPSKTAGTTMRNKLCPQVFIRRSGR